jgi:AcrR family transcriptional regulator
MPEYAVPTSPRRRGRPKGGESGSQDRIIAAAVDEFGELGYDGATMRGIASRAGVDAALVHHYFGTKADLFAHTVGAPMRPDVDIPHLLEGPDDRLGERLVRYILEAWERPDTRKRGVVLLRAGIGNRLTTPLLAGFLQRELIDRIARRADGPDREDAALRATLVASQVAGLLVARYVLQLPALAAASVDDIVARVGPTIQQYLLGEP